MVPSSENGLVCTQKTRTAGLPFVLASPDHGRMVITAATTLAQVQGAGEGMVVADARAIIPSLQVLDDKPGLSEKLLHKLAEWCIRYTPAAAVDPQDGLVYLMHRAAHICGVATTRI
jgi:protein ImuB